MHSITWTSKILDEEVLTASLEKWRAENMRLVFTNGCFDLLHDGHLDLLEFCAKQGDILIIGLNSDSSVKALKGPDRPINSQDFRARILASLEFTDSICIFEAQTPLNLIKKIRPDVLVKGGDYTKEEVVGADLVIDEGGELVLFPLHPGKSSSGIINQIKNK